MSFDPRKHPRDDRGRWAPRGTGPTVQRVMRQYKAGSLKSGRSGTPVTNHKQAFAIGKSVQKRTTALRRAALARQTGNKMVRSIQTTAAKHVALRARPPRYQPIPFHPAIGGGSRRHY